LNQDPAERPRSPKTWFGHPKGVFLIAFSELWERFSFYGMTALLPLYLSADTAAGGWGWSRADALLFYGFYAGLVFIVPVAGGWVANNHLGERRCICLGAVLLAAGHLALAGASAVPVLAEQLTGTDAQQTIVRSGVPLGRIWALDDVRPALDAAAARAGEPRSVALERSRVAIWTYAGVSGMFLFGLVCIVVATGLFKSSVSSIVGKLYPSADARRDAGYAVFLTCVYIGAMLATFTVGGLGEIYGWHYGFGAAAASVTLALVLYLWKAQAYLGDVGVVPDRKASEVASRTPQAQAAGLNREERDRLWVAFAQGVFTTVYAAAFFQKGGLLNLYTREHVDRHLSGTEIPATWFLSVSTLVFMLVTPLLALACLRLARRRRNPSASYKLGAGLLVMGAAYVILGNAEAARVAAGEPAISAVWLTGMYVLFGIGDALVWPHQMALATKLSPSRYTTLTIGVWHLTVGIGIWLAGLIGATVERLGNLSVFSSLAVLCILCGGLAMVITPALQRRMHGAEDTSIANVAPARATAMRWRRQPS